MSSPTIDRKAVELRPSSRVLSWAWWLLALVPIAFELFYSLHHLKLSWDDAAITAAFSRTWAETGRIALTPVSQTVEGFSSVLWFLLLSIPFFFTHNPDAGLIWMKILSAVFFLLSLGLIYIIAWRQLGDRSAAIGSVLLLAYCTMPNLELQNGMEMNLAACLLLLLFHVLAGNRTRRRVLYGSIVSFLLLLTRFEMPFMLGLLLLGFFYATWRNKPNAVPFRDLLKIATATAFCFLVIELWRFHVFGEWMPNTVYAKRFTPYSDWSTPAKFLATRVWAMAEPIAVLIVPIGFAGCACIRWVYLKRLSWHNVAAIHPGIWMLTLGCFLFGAMFGGNWGQLGRMVAAMLPFLILAIVGICISALRDKLALTHVFLILFSLHVGIWLKEAMSPDANNASIQTVEKLGLGADAIRGLASGSDSGHDIRCGGVFTLL